MEDDRSKDWLSDLNKEDEYPSDDDDSESHEQDVPESGAEDSQPSESFPSSASSVGVSSLSHGSSSSEEPAQENAVHVGELLRHIPFWLGTGFTEGADHRSRSRSRRQPPAMGSMPNMNTVDPSELVIPSFSFGYSLGLPMANSPSTINLDMVADASLVAGSMAGRAGMASINHAEQIYLNDEEFSNLCFSWMFAGFCAGLYVAKLT